jgi:hypothetical protein
MSELTPQSAAALHHNLVRTWRESGPEAVAEHISTLEPNDLFYLVMMHTGIAAE